MISANRVSKLAAKLMILFLAVVFPMFVLGVSSFRTNYVALKQKTLETMEQNNRMISTMVKRALQNVFLSQSAVNVDEKIALMIAQQGRVDDYQRYVGASKVLERLSLMKLSLPEVKEIRLHVPSLNRSFISNGTAVRLMYEYELCKNSDIRFVTVKAERDELEIISGYPWLAGQDYKYYFVTEIDCQKLKNDMLVPYSETYDNNYLYWVDEESVSHLITCYGEEKLFNQFTGQTITEGMTSIQLDNVSYWVMATNIGFSGLHVLSLVSEDEVFADMHIQSNIITIAYVVTVFLILMFINAILKTINEPLKKLSEAFAQVQNGKIDTTITLDRKNEFGYIYKRFNDMTLQMKRLIEDNYRSRLLAQKTKMRQLQAQVKPHFLYNCFRNISAMAQMEDYEGIGEITDKLSVFYKYIIKSSYDIVPLYQEAEYACAYLDIQGIRFSDRLELQIDELPEELRDAPTMHFSIQTLTENACKYALPTRSDHNIIALSYEIHADGYVVIVEDNGLNITEQKIEELNKIILGAESTVSVNSGTGLINLHERLLLQWGDNAGLAFSRAALGGLRVEMYVYWRKADKTAISRERDFINVQHSDG